jgi:hypothetical protein
MSELAARNYPESPVSLDVLGTTDCLPILEQLVRFENARFRADFAWSLDQKETWLRSGSLFCSALSHGNRIAALVSVLLTNQRSINQLSAGEITESQMSPWFLGDSGSEPVLYFAPTGGGNTFDLLELCNKLLPNITAYLAAKDLKVPIGYSIAFNPAMEQSLAMNGFEPIPVRPGAPQYPFMRIDALTAKTDFWQRLLTAPAACSDSAKAVESRLRASKAERYRDFYKAR